MQILLLAYACDPLRGSEHGVGWAFLKSYLDRNYQVTLITQTKNLKNIELNLDEKEKNGLKIWAFQLPSFFYFLKKQLPFGTQLYYIIWQNYVGYKLRKINLLDFEFAHHVTFANDSLPSALFKLRMVKRIWGPVGGISRTKIINYRYLGIKGSLHEFFRVISNSINRFYITRTKIHKLNLVICQNADGEKYFSKYTEVCVSSNAFLDDSFLKIPHKERVPHMILGVGRLDPLKGWAIAIQALKYLPDSYELHLVGKGYDRKRLVKVARRIGVASRVKFLGELERNKVMELMTICDVFVFPSLHEGAGWVLCEAASMGASIVAFDIAGPRSVLGNSANFVDPVGNLPKLFAKGIHDSSGKDLNRRYYWTKERLLSPVIKYLDEKNIQK